MILRQTLKKKVNGYWDGGPKDIFDWSIQGSPAKDSEGEYVKIGSFNANHWFHVAKGKTERLTLSYAMCHLRSMLEGKGILSTFEYVG